MNKNPTERTDIKLLPPAKFSLVGKLLQRINTLFPWWLIHACLLTLWLLIHLPAIYYGTHQLPFHTSYVGDEQSPLTGALQIVQTQNPLTIYNLSSLYYGPLFAVAAIPAVVGDYVIEGVKQGNFDATWYKNHVLYDWGGILWKMRVIALLVSYLGLLALYRILTTKTVNPQRSQILALVGTALLATNFYYFEYGGFYRHWVFIMVPILWQLYFLIKIEEHPEKTNRYFAYQALLAAAAFGISYVSLLSQVILLPVIIKYLRTFDKKLRNGLVVYATVLTGVGGVLAAWHPYEIVRYFSIFTSDILRVGTNEYSIAAGDTAWSFGYYWQVLFANHVSLMIALGILLLSIKLISPVLRSILVSCLLLAGVYFAIVGPHSIHVSRYMLPVIMMLIVAVAILLVRLYPTVSRVQKISLWILLSTYVLYHVISIGFWLVMTSQGPSERFDINQILALQSESLEAEFIVARSQMFGWPHTIDSYQQFATEYELGDRPQFQGYFDSTSPDTSLLRMNYSSRSDLGIIAGFDYLVLCENPVLSGDIEEDHQEVILARLWTTNYYWQPSCSIYPLYLKD